MPDLYRRGVPVGLASDVAKVWGYGEQGYLGYLLSREYGDYLAPEDVLTMATVHGARSVGLADRAGSLEAGKWADVVVENAESPEMHPLTSRIRNTTLTARGRSVDTVVVAGRVVLDGSEPVLVSRADVYAMASKAVENIRGRADFDAGERWPVTTG
jgi:5-methylthioadenosine/S-adenosylhomocysteine deaminase